jgi:hypothetical protein
MSQNVQCVMALLVLSCCSTRSKQYSACLFHSDASYHNLANAFLVWDHGVARHQINHIQSWRAPDTGGVNYLLLDEVFY